jgi:hypothetical protein
MRTTDKLITINVPHAINDYLLGRCAKAGDNGYREEAKVLVMYEEARNRPAPPPAVYTVPKPIPVVRCPAPWIAYAPLPEHEINWGNKKHRFAELSIMIHALDVKPKNSAEIRQLRALRKEARQLNKQIRGHA